MELERGQKFKLQLIYLDCITYFTEPRYYADDGMRFVHKFDDKEGNLYVWKTSSPVCMEVHNEKGYIDYEHAEIGDEILLAGTVKDFSNFRGEDQIVVTRCKLIGIENKQLISEEDIRSYKQRTQLSRIQGDYRVKTVTYKDYKNKFSDCSTLVDSFVRNENGCFIDIILVA